MGYFKAFIRVVKSLNVEHYNAFGTENVAEERLIEATDKAEVKKILLEMYPQFFPTNKVYEKETKDTAQFFYVVIFELYEWEKQQLTGTEWVCSQCGQKHANAYISKPRYSKLFADKMFCRSDEDYCLEQFKKEYYKNVELRDDEYYITKESLNYIYRITEKSSGKCYVGKTKNAPFFRWWNHLTRSSSPFGLYLQKSKLSDWTFEVLEILPNNISDSEVFRIESDYIKTFNSINNGFNSVMSKALEFEDKNQMELELK